MIRNIFFLSLALTLSACQTYRTQFDCPPGRGVPCASVSEIERMIVETEEGPDFLMAREPGCGCDTRVIRVWVPNKNNCREGQYLYLNVEDAL